jgi:hypothetical protein
MLMYLIAGCFLNLTLCMTKLWVLVLSFPDFMDISNAMVNVLRHLSVCMIYIFDNLYLVAIYVD